VEGFGCDAGNNGLVHQELICVARARGLRGGRH